MLKQNGSFSRLSYRFWYIGATQCLFESLQENQSLSYFESKYINTKKNSINNDICCTCKYRCENRCGSSAKGNKVLG